MTHFIYVKLQGLAAIADGLIMLTLGARFAVFQWNLCKAYMHYQSWRYRRTHSMEEDNDD